MGKRIMILEVSQKQAYIFASRKLKENCERSQQIADVTGKAFFKDAWPCFSEENMVYSGGGHSVVQFDDVDSANSFARAVTFQALKSFPGMELYVTQIAYNERLTPQENLLELTKALEQKKARRQQSFRQIFPNGVPLYTAMQARKSEFPPAPHGWSWTNDVNRIAGEDHFLAVVHLDGNSMGKRVQKIYDKYGKSWDSCREKLQLFSEEIDKHFAESFDEMIQDLVSWLEEKKWPNRTIPVRKLIGAGDDVCFITRGIFGLECAASFLDHLRQKVNLADGQHYSACAGVVMIHTTAPFRQAYDLSESLCKNAKIFVEENGGDFDALDYHIEFGQIKNALSEIQDNLQAEDGSVMSLRPLALSDRVQMERRYDYFTFLLRNLQEKADALPHSKLKALRTAFQQGEIEAELAMRMSETKSKLTMDGSIKVYFDDAEGRRCAYYDPIEMMDHVQLWRKESK